MSVANLEPVSSCVVLMHRFAGRYHGAAGRLRVMIGRFIAHTILQVRRFRATVWSWRGKIRWTCGHSGGILGEAREHVRRASCRGLEARGAQGEQDAVEGSQRSSRSRRRRRSVGRRKPKLVFLWQCPWLGYALDPRCSASSHVSTIGVRTSMYIP